MTEQRKHARFDLKLPLELVRTGRQTVLRPGETKNLSCRGVLFTSDAPVNVGEAIEYLITLPTPGEVRIRCLGKVTRLERAAAGGARVCAVAATLDRYEFVRPAR